MDAVLSLLDTIPDAGDGGGGGGPSGGSTTSGSVLAVSKDREINHNSHYMSIEDSSSYPNGDDDEDDEDDLELGLGLSIGAGLKTKEEASGILTTKESPSLMSSSSSSSSSNVNIPNSSIAGTKRTASDSVSPPNVTSVVGWPPIRRAHRLPIFTHRIKSEHQEFSKNIAKGRHLSVKVNMDGTPIGRKVDLYAHSSYEMLAQTLENMFYGTGSSTEAVGSSRLLNGTSGFVLTYEDKDGDCMLVGDVPWQMFLSSVKRLRILRNALMQH